MRFPLILSLFCVCALAAYPQVPIATGVQILKAEDARRYDVVLEKLMQSPNAAVRTRAALAAGRIGDDRAVEPLVKLLADDKVESVRAMAAFAVGEIESVKGADALELAFIRESPNRTGPGSPIVFGRVIEAAGKIVAANPKDPLSAGLRETIIYALKTRPNNAQTANLLLTAALRARPDGGAPLVAAFLDDPDAEIRADALNTLTRIRAKERLADIRGLLRRDPDPVVRANAARALGAAEDKDAFPLLLDYAVNGDDLRVRVACIRSLRSLKNPDAAKPLIDYGRNLLGRLKTPNAPEKNELLEIAVVVGYLLEKTGDPTAIAFLNETSKALGYRDTEVFSAITHVSPRAMLEVKLPPNLAYRDAQVASAYALGLSEIAFAKDDALTAEAGRKLAQFVGGMATGVRPADQAKMVVAMPSLTTAMAELKPDNIDEILRGQLKNDDPFVRAAAAGAIAERPRTDANVEALKSAFIIARLKDKHDNDAKLATLEALVKLDKKEAVGSLLMSLDDPDYLVRKRIFEVLADPELQAAFPGISTSLESARAKHKDQVLAFSPIWGTRLGQVLNTDLDYRRALSRKNGSIRAVLTTEKGPFTIEFAPEEAPLTVDNFVKLARAGYFNGLEVHRVVPNFVMQDGDPRGDGNGGPGWSIRCEVNVLPYDRGAVGMALSGKDTGGSQWFVTHSPQPHLDGGYTVFGHVAEKDMKVVDSIVRGDRILRVKIIGR